MSMKIIELITRGQKNKEAQGAIEYLLLLAAAVVVVSVVIAYMISTITPAVENPQTYEYLCRTLDTNSLACGCYTCNPSKGNYSSDLGKYAKANVADCEALAEKISKQLKVVGKCTNLPAS
jgi:uncharacterized protein (UPF0333 family)